MFIAVGFAVAVAAALTTGGDPSSAAPGIVAAVTETPFRIALPPSDSPTATASSTTQPTPAISDAATAEPTAESDAATPILNDAWNSTPAPVAPTPTAILTDPVAALIDSIQSTYGVRIVSSNQDWGADEGSQLRNLNAVAAALAAIPGNVRATNNANAGGALTFLSNDGGRTAGGWQPYGDRAANYYTNEDNVGGSRVAANAVVLQPGSTSQTSAHEMMHAYQMRGIAPGDYAGALLTNEMKSFMQATGWTQTVSDAQVRADANSWDALNADFRYDGRSLAYTNEWGDSATLFAPNPLEAYAETGGLYYGHSAATTLPDWTEYWGWFAANLG